jgi:hypothetical protein
VLLAVERLMVLLLTCVGERRKLSKRGDRANAEGNETATNTVAASEKPDDATIVWPEASCRSNIHCRFHIRHTSNMLITGAGSYELFVTRVLDGLIQARRPEIVQNTSQSLLGAAGQICL